MQRTILKRISSMMIITFLFIAILFSAAAPSYAATVKTIPSTSTMVAKANKLKLSKDNYSVTWNITNHKVKTGKNSEKLLCIPIKNKTAAWTVTNFCKVKFTNAGVIDGRQIDCTVNFDSMTVTARKGSSTGETSDGYMGFASIWGIDDGLQVGVTIDDGCGYRAKKTVKYTATITYHDTGEVVNLPFFQAVRDLDAMNTYYREAWESISGYTGIYYKYNTNYNTFSGNKVLAPNSSDQMVTGNNELLKAGIYAPTTGGKFSAYFYGGNCGTLMTLYSQYSTNPSVFVNLVKTVDKAAARPGDTVTYTVKHTMGTFYKTAMTVYGKLEITDVIPENLEYVSAALTNGAGNNITGQGTLTYDESTRTLKFVMGDTWRNNISNYNGQVLKFTVTTKVMDFEGYEATAENKATLSYENNLSVDTNLVTTNLTKPYMVQIVKSISGSADQLGDGHGRPTFIFKVSGKNTGDVYYESVTFGDENASAGWTFSKENGRWIATGRVLELPDDEYSVTELDVSRFKMTGSSVYSSGNYRRFTFENEKDNWQYFSHKSVVINKLKGGAAGE